MLRYDIKKIKYMNFRSIKTTEQLGDGDAALDVFCPLDGTRMVSYSGDPHNVTRCPCCREDFIDGPDIDKEHFEGFLESNNRRLNELEKELKLLKKIKEVSEDPTHPIKLYNKNNS